MNAPVHVVVREQLRHAYDAWVANGGDMKRVKILTGYTAKSRWLAETTSTNYVVPMNPDTPSPYMFSDTRSVSVWKGQTVVVYETRHRRYEVFAVEGPLMENQS